MAETISTVEILEEIPEVDISDSVREFAGQNGDYYTREFKRIQASEHGFCWTFNLGSAAFGPLWATARGLWGLFWIFSVVEMVLLVMLGLGLWGDLGSDKFNRADRLQVNYERMLDRVETAQEKGDTEGVASFQKRADSLAKARDKALAEGEAIKAGGTRLLIIAIIGLALMKLFEGWGCEYRLRETIFALARRPHGSFRVELVDRTAGPGHHCLRIRGNADSVYHRQSTRIHC